MMDAAVPPTAAGAGAPASRAGTGGAGSSGMAGSAAGVKAMDAGAPPPTQPAAGSGGSAAPVAGMPAAMNGGAPAMPMDAGMSAPGACDHACLLAVMQGYIDALLAHDPTKIKTSAMLKYSENGVEAKLGETVWMTAKELVAGARLDFADPQEGQVTSQLVFNETNSMPVIYQVRLKVVANEITEIESMAVRRATAANMFFNTQNMKPEAVFLQAIPPEMRMKRDELKAITELYLDYLEGKKTGRQVPFDTGCKRYENGQVTASGNSFNTQMWSFQLTRRILVIDEEMGITWGLFPFMQTQSPLVVGEAFKIIGGKIMMIQAVMAYQPVAFWK
jgi:hypothetical protein